MTTSLLPAGDPEEIEVLGDEADDVGSGRRRAPSRSVRVAGLLVAALLGGAAGSYATQEWHTRVEAQRAESTVALGLALVHAVDAAHEPASQPAPIGTVRTWLALENRSPRPLTVERIDVAVRDGVTAGTVVSAVEDAIAPGRTARVVVSLLLECARHATRVPPLRVVVTPAGGQPREVEVGLVADAHRFAEVAQASCSDPGAPDAAQYLRPIQASVAGWEVRRADRRSATVDVLVTATQTALLTDASLRQPGVRVRGPVALPVLQPGLPGPLRFDVEVVNCRTARGTTAEFEVVVRGRYGQAVAGPPAAEPGGVLSDVVRQACS